MGYSLHIERKNSPITIAEWKKAVNEIHNARLQSTSVIGLNPSTGEKIEIPANEGDVEVLFAVNGIKKLFGGKPTWEHAISFHNGRAVFSASEDIENKSNPIHQVATALAKKLNAIIRGDEGEEYKW